MSPLLDGDGVLRGSASTPSRPPVQPSSPSHTPGRNLVVTRPTIDEAALYRPKMADQLEFDAGELRLLGELSSAGRAGLRRALIKQKQDDRATQREKRATRTAAMNVLLAQQRRLVIARAPSGLSGVLTRSMRKRGQARPSTMVPALPLAQDLWHSALMTAELGYNAQDLNLPGGSLRFETVNPQLLNNDRLHYQRPMVEERVQKYLGLETQELAQRIGVLACREDDSLWVIDGQHHTEAAVRAGIDVMGYWVFDSNAWDDERKVFDAFQAWKRGMGRVPDEPVG